MSMVIYDLKSDGVQSFKLEYTQYPVQCNNIKVYFISLSENIGGCLQNTNWSTSSVGSPWVLASSKRTEFAIPDQETLQEVGNWPISFSIRILLKWEITVHFSAIKYNNKRERLE